MSYNKRTWANGNVVGAVDLNRIESGIADIDVDEIRGWSTQNTQLFSETVTAVAEEFGNIATLAYTGTNASDLMSITYDGTAYACARIDLGDGVYGYGDMNLIDYPFILGFDGFSWSLMAQTTGSHTIVGAQVNVETSTEFVSAVNSITNTSTMPLLCISGVTTYDEIQLAVSQKRLMYFVDNSDMFWVITQITFTTQTDATVTFYPQSSLTSASVTNGVFTVTES